MGGSFGGKLVYTKLLTGIMCQNPLLGNVLRSRPHCIHERNHQRIQIQLHKREQTPPR